MGRVVTSSPGPSTARKERMAMVRTFAAPLIALAAASLVAAACRPLPISSPTRPTTGQGYPPPGTPTPPPDPTATPTADTDGYLPPPLFPPSEPVRLLDGPFADLLVPLQAALDAGDGTWFGARVDDGRPLDLFDVREMDGEGGTALDSAGTAALAAAFGAAGSRPKVQAYFVEPRETITCLYVLTHRWQGDVAFPGYSPDQDATPRIGPPLPPTVPLDGAAFHVCRGRPAEWLLDDWITGGYYDLVAHLGGLDGGGTLFVVRP